METRSDFDSTGTSKQVLSHLSAVLVSGSDARRFLHAQLSADIQDLAVGASCLAAYCSPQGRVLAVIGCLVRSETDFLLITHRTLAATLAQRLSMYVLHAAVEIGPAPQARRLAAVVADAGAGISLWRHPLDPARALVEAAEGHAVPVPAIDALQWRLSDIRAGLAWINAESSGRYLPQMLGLDVIGAVSYTKGCYPGQEVIAKAHYLGRVKRRLAWASGTIDAGTIGAEPMSIGDINWPMPLQAAEDTGLPATAGNIVDGVVCNGSLNALAVVPEAVLGKMLNLHINSRQVALKLEAVRFDLTLPHGRE